MDVIIIGAGLAGLCGARTLQQAGFPFALLAASMGGGGRVQTDRVGGFLLDQGFQ
jgi:monoamine oxidase